MVFDIVSELPGRLRLRCGRNLMTEEEAKTYVPKVVMVDENNHPINVRGTEKEAEIG